MELNIDFSDEGRLMLMSYDCPTEDCYARIHSYLLADLYVEFDNLCIRCSQVSGLGFRATEVGKEYYVKRKPETPIDRVLIEPSDGVDDYEFGEPSLAPVEVFDRACNDLLVLQQATIHPGLQSLMDRVIFQQYITIMEAFLADTFIGICLRDPTALRNLVLNTDHFLEPAYNVNIRKFVSDPNFVWSKAKIYLEKMSWHNTEKADKICKAIFGEGMASDPQHLERIEKAVKMRHDIVHRNGMTVEKERVIIDEDDIYEIARDVKRLVQNVHELYAKALLRPQPDKR